MKKLICLFLGHKKDIMIQKAQGYGVFVCKRCGTVYGKKV